MYCKNCGKEIPDGSRFCVNCGASQDVAPGYEQQPSSAYGYSQQPNSAYGQNRQPDSGSGYDPRQNQQYREPDYARNQYGNNNQGGGNSDETFGMILKYTSFAMALLWLVFGLKALFGGLGTMITSFTRYSYYRPFFRCLTGFFGVIMAVGFLAEAVSLAATGLSKKKRLGSSCFLLIAGSSVLILVAALFRLIFGSIAYYRFMPGFLLPILWALLSVAIAYVLMMIAGRNPLPSDFKSSVNGISEVFSELMQSVSSLKQNAGGVASAGAGSFKANQQAAFDQRNQNRQNAGYGQNQGQQYQGQQYQGQQFQGQGAAYQNQQFMNQGVPRGTVRLNQSRGLLKYILLNLCTCGIYSFVFIYGIAQDINTACAGDGEDGTGGLGAYILYNILTCGVYGTVWEYSLMNRMKANAPRYGVTITDTGLSLLLWLQLGVFLCGAGPYVAMHKLCKSANTICAAYNRANGL